jgi:hypothetical protein
MPRHTTAKHATCFAVRHSRSAFPSVNGYDYGGGDGGGVGDPIIATAGELNT